MSTVTNAIKLLNNPSAFLSRLGQRQLLNWVPDKVYLKIMYKGRTGKKLDLDNPQRYTEKLQWLKLYDRNPLYIKLVDKYEVREYIKKTIGEQYLVPLIGVYDNVDEIEIWRLPNQFVLKCTHDSGNVIICRNKDSFNFIDAKRKLQKAQRRNFYYGGREWPYKSIKPRIVAEKFLTDSEKSKELTDYKFYCFNGYVDCVMVCYDRALGDTKFYFFDRDWKLKRINKLGISAPRDFSIQKPNCIDEMFYIAEKLSYDIPFVRVDLYQSNDQVYFGEMTFYPSSGFDKNYLPETDLYFGDLIKLDQVKG